jgi:hypothetical protein
MQETVIKKEKSKVIKSIFLFLGGFLLLLIFSFFVVLPHVHLTQGFGAGVENLIGRLRLYIKIIPDQVWPYPKYTGSKTLPSGEVVYFEYATVEEIYYNPETFENRLKVRTLAGEEKTLVYTDNSITHVWFNGVLSYMRGKSFKGGADSRAYETEDLFTAVSYEPSSVREDYLVKYLWSKREDSSQIEPSAVILIGRNTSYLRRLR